MHRPKLLLAVTAATLTLAIHWPVLDVQFWVDEFSDLRPWTRAEVVGGLTGNWDPLGASEPFFRPLTVLLQAAQFELFGFNPVALHVVSLILTTILGALVGLFLWRETRVMAVSIAGMALALAHPMLPDAATAPIKLQMHLLCGIVMLLALVAWQRPATRTVRGWWLIWLLVIAGTFIKEDMAMLAVALPLLHWLRARRWNGPPLTAGIVTSAIAVLAGLAVIRLAALPAFGTSSPGALFELPFGFILREYLYAPYHALFKILITAPIHAQVLPHWPASIVATLLTTAAMVGIARGRTGPAARLAVMGLVLLAIVGLPLAVMSGPTRTHLVAIAAALTWTGGAAALVHIAGQRIIWWTLVGVLTVTLATASRQNTAAFQPCSAWEAQTTSAALTLPSVPDDLRHFLHQRPQQCANGSTSDPLTRMGALRWVQPERTVVLIDTHAPPARLHVHSPAAHANAPISFVAHADGRQISAGVLTSTNAHSVSIPVAATWRTRLRGATRVEITGRHTDGTPAPIVINVDQQNTR